MPILAHEAIHCDNVDGRFEEIAATAIDTFLFMQLLAVSPDLASAATLLSREASIDAIALINSGRRLPESIGVLRSVGVTKVLPASGSTAPAFAEFVAAAYAQIDYNDSPDEPLAQAYVQTLAKQAGLPVASAFNLKYLDELLGGPSMVACWRVPWRPSVLALPARGRYGAPCPECRVLRATPRDRRGPASVRSRPVAGPPQTASE